MSAIASIGVMLLAAVVAGVAVGVTRAAFSSVASTSGSSFTADTRYDGLRLATGSYTGNATDNRAITAPDFRPDVVIVKAATAQVGVIRTSTMSGDAAKPTSGSTALTANLVQSLDASGFTLGTDARVNGSGVSYTWTAIKADDVALRVGSYTGIGAIQSLTSLGFSPSFVAVIGPNATTPVLRMTGMSRAFPFDTGTGSTTQITGLLATGFSLGTDAAVNTNGATYHYLAFDDVAGQSRVATYTGNATSGRSITGTGFQPQYVVVRANDTTTSRAGRHRPASLAGTSSQTFNGAANVTTSITALQSNGFQVGNDGSVNANGVGYMSLALRDVGT